MTFGSKAPFTQVASNIKGFACKFAQICLRVLCEWGLRPKCHTEGKTCKKKTKFVLSQNTICCFIKNAWFPLSWGGGPAEALNCCVKFLEERLEHRLTNRQSVTWKCWFAQPFALGGVCIHAWFEYLRTTAWVEPAKGKTPMLKQWRIQGQDPKEAIGKYGAFKNRKSVYSVGQNTSHCRPVLWSPKEWTAFCKNSIAMPLLLYTE